MSYILTVWLLVSGSLIQGQITLAGERSACAAHIARVQAQMPSAVLVRAQCVLEVEA